MSQVLNVLLGANGDLCAMLPFLKLEAERMGSPAPLFVAKAYAPLLEGVSYVTPVVWPGKWDDLNAALRFLRADLPQLKVRMLQFYQSRHDPAMRSFLDEMWYQAGEWRGWEDRPLVFDRRDAEREGALVRAVNGQGSTVNGGRPVILVCGHGSKRSIAFKEAGRMLRMIRREFGRECVIVDLAKVKAHRFHDLLGLYERAAALVSVDTGHLHLSRAVPGLPVFALARDWPSVWHGTPWQERFAFYCRYSEFTRRWEEMRGALRAAVKGQGSRVNGSQGLTVVDKVRGYNAGMFRCMGREVLVTRVHRGRSWKTDLLVDGKVLSLPAKWRECSHEDARVFECGESRYASLTLATSTRRHRARCVQAVGEMLWDRGEWRMRDLVVPRYGRNDWTGTEKNWVFFEHAGAVHAIYSCAPSHVVLELDFTGGVLREWRTRGPRWAWGQVRGGTPPVAWGSTVNAQRSTGPLWLRFFHSRVRDTRKRVMWRDRYFTGALLMESRAPFRVVAVSRAPLWSGDERPSHWSGGPWKVWHWKPNVVIPYGCVAVEAEGQGSRVKGQGETEAHAWKVSLGVNDCFACTAVVTREMLDGQWVWREILKHKTQDECD